MCVYLCVCFLVLLAQSHNDNPCAAYGRQHCDNKNALTKGWNGSCKEAVHYLTSGLQLDTLEYVPKTQIRVKTLVVKTDWPVHKSSTNSAAAHKQA